MKVKNICCIGAGYVGGPTMAVIASKCTYINVTVVDVSPEKIKAWNGPLDKLPVYEPGLAEVVEKTRGRNLFFSEDIKGNIEKSEMIFISVNTPTKTEGEGAGKATDLRHVEACAKDIAKYSKSDKIIIEKSTLPVRTAEKIKEILKSNSENIHFEVLSNPEFLAEGRAIEDLLYSDRVLVGGDETESGQKAVQALVDIYANWISREKILTTNVWTSELAKLASNAMLAQRISSINSLSVLCKKTGANINELSKIIGADHRIGPHFLKVSVGFGGSCFQKDILNLVYLCQNYGLDEVAEYWHQVLKINDYQKKYFTEMIIQGLNGVLNSKKITLLGWAFKKDTTDSRESAAIYIAHQLLEEGAELHIYDPMVSENQILRDMKELWNIKAISVSEQNNHLKQINVHKLPKQAIKDSFAVAIITEWDEFIDYDWEYLSSLMVRPIKIFDGRNILNQENIISI